MPWDSQARRLRLPPNWPALREEVLRRDNHQCRIRGPRCVVYATDCDHKTPGDDHTLTNLQAACAPCHRAKSSTEGNTVWAARRAQAKHPGETHPGLV